MMKTCPNCHAETFAKQNQTLNLKDILNRWEAETSARFSEETRAQYEPVGTTIFYRCETCHFGAFQPAASGTGSFYNDITVDGDYYVSEKWEFKRTFDLIEAKEPSSVLDYGCGGGAFLKQATARFPTTIFTGYDQNPQAAISFEKTGISFTHDLAGHKDKGYDLITAFQILEHLEDPFSALQQLHDALNENGTIVISVPNLDGPIRHFPDALTEIPPHHVNRFNKSSLMIYLRNAGFKVEQISYEPLARILWPFYLPVMARKSLPSPLQKIYTKLHGDRIIQTFVKILNKTSLKSIPLTGHSIYIVARKCAE